jgi:hypothetical protein
MPAVTAGRRPQHEPGLRVGAAETGKGVPAGATVARSRMTMKRMCGPGKTVVRRKPPDQCIAVELSCCWMLL